MKTQKICTIEEFNDIQNTLVNEYYLFRGESQPFEHICSGLYRYKLLPTNTYITVLGAKGTIRVAGTISPDNSEEITSGIQQAQSEISKNIVNHIRTNNLTETSSFSTEYIQHYGGMTNYIDFTTNFGIAAYFSCSTDINEDGRIIIINRKNYKCIDLHKDLRFTKNKRIQKQKSVLIEQDDGCINPNNCEAILTISKHLKKDILSSLEAKDINDKSIYPDEGDIETNQYIQQLKLELLNLPKHLAQAEKLHTMGLDRISINKGRAIRILKNSIKEHNMAIKINPNYHTPHTLKAEILLTLHELTGEFAYANESLECCNKSITLKPNGEEPYLHNPRFKTQIVTHGKKGIAYRIKGIIYKRIYNDYNLALKNLNKAIEINPQESQAYYHRGLIFCMQYETSATREIKIQKLDMAIKDFQKQIDVNPKQKDYPLYTKCLELKDRAITARNNLENH